MRQIEWENFFVCSPRLISTYYLHLPDAYAKFLHNEENMARSVTRASRTCWWQKRKRCQMIRKVAMTCTSPKLATSFYGQQNLQIAFK